MSKPWWLSQSSSGEEDGSQEFIKNLQKTQSIIEYRALLE